MNIYKIEDWAEKLGIFDKSDKKSQFIKMVEEVGEIAECISKDRPLSELELELGDLFVTGILLARLAGTDAEKCLDAAYDKINGRTGQMVNGSFIRDEESSDGQATICNEQVHEQRESL